MSRINRSGVVRAALLTAFLTGALSPRTEAQTTPNAYPNMAAIARYQMADRAAEIALARSAAPASISDNADVMVLGAHGYERAVRGSNGFVCIIERSWANDFDSPQFWNPNGRAAICFNPAAARSVLPTYLTRTEWVLAGVPRAEMAERTRAAIAAHVINPPEPGAMCYMMAKGGYLSDNAPTHWKPHLMFFLPRTQPGEWGANLPGGAVIAFPAGDEPLTTFLVPLGAWSDGTPAEPMAPPHEH